MTLLIKLYQHNCAFLAVAQWNIDHNDHFPTNQSMTVGTSDYKYFKIHLTSKPPTKHFITRA